MIAKRSSSSQINESVQAHLALDQCLPSVTSHVIVPDLNKQSEQIDDIFFGTWRTVSVPFKTDRYSKMIVIIVCFTSAN